MVREPDATIPAVEPPPLGEALDRHARAMIARWTGGVSVLGLAQAWQDWAFHLAASPGRQMMLAQKAVRLGVDAVLRPEQFADSADPRFRGPGWRTWPFNAYASGFLATEEWWRAATRDVDGVTDQHSRVAEFAARQLLDVVSPSNGPLTNPDVLTRTVVTGGQNLIQGGLNAMQDVARLARGGGPPAFLPGRDVAVTPGVVVARTPLAEIIQYRPTTGVVRPEPVVIVPAPIMKYYILDLTPPDSLVRGLVEQGFTVFMVSWKNPGPEERDRGFDDYARLGVRAALDLACGITGSPRAHAVGYCLGGTLMSMVAAAMARAGDDRIASLTLLAAQADFTEAGELSLFINESQVSLLEDVMRDRGFMTPEQMSGAFQILRANDLVWSRMVSSDLLGQPHVTSALDAWSADSTRLPFHFQSQNLRQLYLRNDLAEGRFCLEGRPLALRDLDADMFVLGTETDHIAPWRSVYKWLLHCDTDVTFVLTNHGHNVGVVCPPDAPGRRYRLRQQDRLGDYLDPGTWAAEAPSVAGSWWPVWFAWLAARSGAPVPPPGLGLEGKTLGDAPGRYVLER